MCDRIRHNAAHRIDPTRTLTLRREFEGQLWRRFRRLKGEINSVVAKGDGFGLRHNRRFDYPRADMKAAAFMDWLRQAASTAVLGVQYGTPMRSAAQSAWTNVYIEAAYQSGIRRSGAAMRAAGADIAPRWVESAFTRPMHADRVGLIYTRTYSDLVGITDEMGKQISRVLAHGLSEGMNPVDIARSLNDRVDRVGLTRARTMARSEVISAHAEGTLNGFAEAGIDEVEVEAEWATAGDSLVCPQCAALEGRTFTIEQARGMLPLHPNCRCAWLPKVINGTGIVLH